MDLPRSVLRDLNEKVCSVDGITKGFCKESLSSRGINYPLLIVLALFVQYVLPILIGLSMIPIFIGNVIAIMNPFFYITTIIAFFFDLGFMVVFLILGFILNIVYLVFYFKRIGVLALFPILMWIVSIIASLLPNVGNIISTAVSIVPWMALVAVAHWILYSFGSQGKKSEI